MIVQAAYHLLRSGCQIHHPASYQICLMVSCLGWRGWSHDDEVDVSGGVQMTLTLNLIVLTR